MSIESRSRQFGKVFDHWQIKEFLGSGSGGKTAVFRLQRMDSSWGVCALKIVNLIEARGSLEELTDAQLTDYQAAREECSRNAEREVRLMDELRGNTNIVDYLDHTFVDWSEENAFGRDLLIRMELLTDLRSELRRGKCFSEAEIIKIGRDICTALVRCHSKNILHRDVKPENIFRNKDGDYKLGDFGVSRVLDACPGAVASTGIGTYEYWPAEQMTGSYDKRVDIYSLGLVLYELSNRNRLPFAATTYATGREVSLRLAGTALPKPTDASPMLTEIILKACAFKPEERYQSAKAFLKALEQAAQAIENTPEKADRCYATAPTQPSDDSASASQNQPHQRPAVKVQSTKAKKSTGGSYLKEQNHRKKKPGWAPVFLAAFLLVIAAAALLGPRIWKSTQLSSENQLLEAEINETAPAPSQAPEDTQDSTEPTASIRLSAEYAAAEALAASGKTAEAAMAFYKLGDKERSFELWDKVAVRQTVSLSHSHSTSGLSHALGLKEDGTVVAAGTNHDGECNVGDWTDITAVSAGGIYSVGLKTDGTVVAVGHKDARCNVGDWRDIVAISAGGFHTVGLKADGTVVAAGENRKGECDVGDWTNIVAVSAGSFLTVGLRADGTVVAAGQNDANQCAVNDWTDIVAISTGVCHTVGLKADGTVVAAGDDNGVGRCRVWDWRDIVAISAGVNHTVGLKSDGSVVSTGGGEDDPYAYSSWTNIVDISAGQDRTLGLKSDGTIVAAGKNTQDRMGVQHWNNVMLPGFDREQIQSDSTAAEAIRDIPAGTKLIDGTWENGNITVVALDDKTLWMQITDDRPDQQYGSFGTPWEIDLRFGTEMKIEESADDYYIAHPFNIVTHSTASRQLELREYAQEDGMDDSSQRGFNNLHFWQTETDGKRANSLDTALLDIEQNGNTYTTEITLPDWFDISVYDDLVCVDVCLFETDFYEKLHQEGSAQGAVHPFYPTNS